MLQKNKDLELDRLAEYWLKLKNEIDRLRDLLIEAEENIKTRVGTKEEGSITSKTGSYTLRTTSGLTRKLEKGDISDLRERMGPDNFSKLININHTLNLAGYRTAGPDIKRILDAHLTTKPRKTAIKVELREEV